MALIFFLFFFNDTATTEIYTLSLHDALPIFPQLTDRLVEGEPAREPYADPVGRDLLEVGGRGGAELLLQIGAPARRHDHRLAQAERFGERRLELLGARQVELDPDEALVVGALEEPRDRRRRDAERPGDRFLRPRLAVVELP